MYLLWANMKFTFRKCWRKFFRHMSIFGCNDLGDCYATIFCIFSWFHFLDTSLLVKMNFESQTQHGIYSGHSKRYFTIILPCEYWTLIHLNQHENGLDKKYKWMVEGLNQTKWILFDKNKNNTTAHFHESTMCDSQKANIGSMRRSALTERKVKISFQKHLETMSTRTADMHKKGKPHD